MRCFVITALTLAAAYGVIDNVADAAEMNVDLNAPEAASQWAFTDKSAHIADGELVLDGRAAVTRAFFLPSEWGDVSLKARFLVEPGEKGVLCCGFTIGAQDGQTFHFVHYDRTQAILCRSDAQNGWNEMQRAGDLDKPAGAWHEGELQYSGGVLRVWLNGKLLYEAANASVPTGRIGFYASEGLVHVKDIRVTGEPKNAATPFAIPPPLYTHVCTDAGAGGYEAFPDVCRLSDGRLMSVFYAGYGHVALPCENLPKGGRVAYCASSDEGRTWTPAETLYDGPDDDRDPSIAQLKSGTLLCNFFSLQKKDGGSPPWTGLGSWVVESNDLGKTWSEPRLISADYYCSAPVRQLSDGSLILGLYAEKDGRGWGAVTLSNDDGKTWSPVIDIDNGGMPLDAETDIIELKDGSLFAAERGRDKTMGWSVSTDRGRTWAVSKPFGFPGHCPYLHRAPGDIILMAHRLPNTSLHYSLDECKTWSENVLVDNVIGAYPSMVTLKDDTILIVYYEEGEGSSIRAKRFRATRDGLEWLPFEPAP